MDRVKELALLIGPAGDDAAMDRALEALASTPGVLGCMRYERRRDGLFDPPTRPTRRIDPNYVPCRIESAFPDGGKLEKRSGTLVLDTERGDCVFNLVRDNRYDWIYVQVPPGVAEDGDRWLVSAAEGVLARFPYRMGFLVGAGMDGLGTEIIDLAADYERHGLPAKLRCDYLCPEDGQLTCTPREAAKQRVPRLTLTVGPATPARTSTNHASPLRQA